MSRPNCPWFRKSKGVWYARVGGRQVSLGVKGKGSCREALAAYDRLLSQSPARPPTPLPPPPAVTVRSVFDAFFASAELRLKPATVARYRYDAGVFAEALGSAPAADLTPDRIAAWLHSLKVTDTTRAIMLRSVSAVLGWAARAELIPSNPARKVSRPRTRIRSRDRVISGADHARLLAACTPQLRHVLEVLHETGARPGEVCRITAESLDTAAAVVTLWEHKSDRTGRPRVLYLTPRVNALLASLKERYGTGPLLRSRKGVAWTAKSVTQAMRRLRLRTRVRAVAYSYRHTFATDALAGGVPEAHVAELLGHTSTAVLHRHYSHLGTRSRVLLDSLGKVR